MQTETTAGTAPATITLDADLSPALRAIENAYFQIRKAHPGVPEATIVIKRDERAWGHTTVAKVWSTAKGAEADRLEIMISGENLARGAEAVAATLLHEAAHASNLAAGILDCDVNGRHNLKFKAAAEAHGLTVESNGWHGWTKTSLAPEQAKAWAPMIRTIAKGLERSAKAHRPVAPVVAPVVVPVTAGGRPIVPPVAPVAPRKRGNRNLIKATCACGDSIRASRGVLERCRPTCENCEEPFEAAA